MCGIFGSTGVTKATVKAAHAALHTLAHRGPDAWDFTLENGVYSGHRRLAIMDLSDKGKQPMVHGNVHLTVNGEIYNFAALRAELAKTHKVKFKSHSDSEVLLHGYIHWGLDTLLARVDGMFAFAIYDGSTGKVHLARDHAGIKPLYYSLINGKLAWASELKALEQWHGPLPYDRTALYDFFTYLYIPAPKSLYKDVYKLEAASSLTFDVARGKVSKRRYWSLPVTRDITDEAKARALVQDALLTTIKEQMVADVPVGTFLSGGVDSSIVSYECAQILKATKNVLNTCSIGFDDPRVDESRFAKAVAEHIGSRHTSKPVPRDAVNKNFALLRDLYDEPFGDTSAFPTYFVSALAKKQMTVVLTGDGGDEVFGGYAHYGQWWQALTPWLGFLFPLRAPVAWLKNKGPLPLRGVARKIEPFTIIDPLERQARWRGAMLRDDPLKVKLRALWNIADDYDDHWFVRPWLRRDLPWRSRAMYLDFHTVMAESILTKVDRASMKVAIETRVPFLAKRVIEAAWRVDEKVLFLNGTLKGLLKSLYDNKLPAWCLYRKKQGFSISPPKKGDKLALGGKRLPEVLVKELYPRVAREIGL